MPTGLLIGGEQIGLHLAAIIAIGMLFKGSALINSGIQ
jgi:hypothetical protein